MPEIAYEYEPWGGARELFHYRGREALIEGPAGTGKTRCVLQKLHAAAEHHAGIRIFIGRATRISMNESVLITYERHVLPPNHFALQGPHRSHRQTYTYANGSEIICGGFDNSDRIMSTEFDRVAVFEATEITEEDWEKLLTRLGRNAERAKRYNYAQAIADCNPAGPDHWLNLRCERGAMHRITSRHADNPTLSAEYLDSLSKLSGVRRDRLYLGKWVGAEGLVYEQFNRSVHVVERLNESPRVIVGVDDGTRNPFAALRCEVDADGNAHIKAERYRAGLLESAKVQAVKSLAGGAEVVLVDPAAAGLKLALRNSGLPVQDANNDVIAGICKVQDRFAANTLTIDSSCTNLVKELQVYQWADNAKKDVPIKEMDHACFVAGTMIETDTGQVPIERVRVGDRVLTRAGYMRVAVSMKTGFKRVYRLRTSVGDIVGTGDHPVWSGNAFARLDSLRYGDAVLVCQTKRSLGNGFVLAVAEEGFAPVYGLAVDECHEYFANGVLVSNCDALRYLIAYLDSGAGARVFVGMDKPDEKPRERLSFDQRRADPNWGFDP